MDGNVTTISLRFPQLLNGRNPPSIVRFIISLSVLCSCSIGVVLFFSLHFLSSRSFVCLFVKMFDYPSWQQIHSATLLLSFRGSCPLHLSMHDQTLYVLCSCSACTGKAEIKSYSIIRIMHAIFVFPLELTENRVALLIGGLIISFRATVRLRLVASR